MVSRVVITGLSDHSVNAEFIIHPAATRHIVTVITYFKEPIIGFQYLSGICKINLYLPKRFLLPSDVLDGYKQIQQLMKIQDNLPKDVTFLNSKVPLVVE